MKRYLLSLALLCLVATGAHAYWQSRAQVAISGGGLPGPPVFTFTDIQSGSTSTNVCTSNSLAIGTATANRRVYVFAIDAATGSSPQAATGATLNGGTIPTDVFQVIGTTATSGMDVYLISAVVPSGTTATVELTYPTATSNSARFGVYTVDATTLNSRFPVATAQNVIASGTTNPASANTFGIATSTAGSAILAGFMSHGGASTDETITSSDASLSTDGTFGNQMVGHANSAPVSAQSNVNTGWSVSGVSLLALAVFR